MVVLDEVQKEAVEFVVSRDKAILGMKAGTGKTYATFEILKRWGLDKPDSKILVISIANDINKKDWEKQAKEYGFSAPLDTVSYNSLRVKKRYDKYIKQDWDVVIVDECHHVKSNFRKTPKRKVPGFKGTIWDKNDSGRIRNFAERCQRVIGLSGSISPNDFVETFQITRSLNMNPFSFESEDTFVETFYKYKEIPTSYGTRKIPTEVKGKAEEDLMFKTFDKVVFKYFPEDMDHELDFVYIDKPLHPKYKQTELKIWGDDTITHLEQTQKLQQLANGFYYEQGDTIVLDKYKQERLRELLKGREGLVDVEKDNIVIVYKYKEDQDQIEEVLEELGIEAVLLQASQSEAINIQENNVMIFYSPTFSHKDYEQMKGRIMRRGQERIPRFIMMCRSNTIEDYIFEVLERKGTASDLYREYGKGRKKKTLTLGGKRNR